MRPLRRRAEEAGTAAGFVPSRQPPASGRGAWRGHGRQRGRVRLFLCAALVGSGATAGAPLHAQEPPARLVTFLRQRIGVDSAQLASVERGDAVVKVLDTQNKRDVAVFGIIRADVPREFYTTRLQDFPESLKTPTRPRFGIFHDPASPRDVEAVTSNHEDLAGLKDCRPGDCKIKLPATEMERFRTQIDWSAADPQLQADTYLRQRLVQYVTDYRARGDSAMVVYDDTGRVRASDAFAALLAQSPYVYQDVPSLQQYLAGYPHGKLDGVREVLFWAEDSLPGLKPILSVTHSLVYAPPESPGVTLIAAKQIYADHYFEAAFDLTAIVDDARVAGRPGIYLVVLRRSRFDDLPSGPVVSIRSKVVGKLRDQLRVDLERQKLVSEQALRSSERESH